ncbi:hypothetical protein [Halarcobacter anaerophilus]|nr:hypothetical protein [Halarcobacter anaerophilus]
MVCAELDRTGLVLAPVKNNKRRSDEKDIATNGSNSRIFVNPSNKIY